MEKTNGANPKCRRVYDMVTELDDLVAKQGDTILNLIRHPESTQAQIVEAAENYRRTWQQNEAGRARAIEFLRTDKHPNAGRYFDALTSRRR